MTDFKLQQLNKHQIRSGVIDTSHVDITTIGKSLITKLIAGDGLAISSYSGADSGTGVVTLQLDSSLSSLASLTGIGFLTRLENESIAARELTVSANLTITNPIGANGNPQIDLSNTGVTAGTYKYLTTDIKGRVTAGYKYLETWIANEVLVNSGDNIHYTIANTPVNGTDMIFVSGVKQIPGADRDYTISGTTVTFTTPNLSQDSVVACYFYNTSGINNQDIQTETLQPFNDSYMRYRLSHVPELNSQVVFANGLLQRIGSDNDYTMQGQDVVFNNTMQSADTISVLYWR